MEPYPQHFLSAIEKLSFHSEDCKKKSCRCSELRVKPRKSLNYANSPHQHKPIIREAKLKIHHSEKDTKQIIRAARLKIFKQGQKPGVNKSSAGAQCKLLSSQAKTSPTHSPTSESGPLFGAVSSATSLEFGKLFKGVKEARDSKPVLKFSDYRSQVCPYKRRRADGSQDSSSRGSYSDCGKEMRDSHSAGFDDNTSVEELAGYFDDCVHIPRKMSSMAEMMYT